jgi:uncharacterized protein YkwD
MQAFPQFFRCSLRSICFWLIVITAASCDTENIRKNENVRTELLNRINTLRNTGCTCGNEWMTPVNALNWNTILEDAALRHATDMYLNNYFSHLSRDGKSPIDRASKAGYPGDYVGEVIARKYYTAKDVIEAWKESESHCRALMDSLYDEIGGARKEDYWVVDLGRSK